MKEAKKLFFLGGENTLLATNLLSRINALKSAITMCYQLKFPGILRNQSTKRIVILNKKYEKI